jgi:hypothetical protein
MVVDYAQNTPLSGVQVSLAAFMPGAAPSPVATTSASGAFSFTAPAGKYLLVIGSNAPVSPSATSATTTLTTVVTLVAGTNALTAPIPPAEPSVTLTAAQMSGTFRLTALSGNELNYFTAANQGRMQDTPPLATNLLIPDEYLTETATAESQEGNAQPQNGAEPVPLFANIASYQSAIGGVPFGGGTTSGFEDPCSGFAGPSFAYVSGNDPFQFATNPANIYYGANGVGTVSPLAGVSAQAWATDPR